MAEINTEFSELKSNCENFDITRFMEYIRFAFQGECVLLLKKLAQSKAYPEAILKTKAYTAIVHSTIVSHV